MLQGPLIQIVGGGGGGGGGGGFFGLLKFVIIMCSYIYRS